MGNEPGQRSKTDTSKLNSLSQSGTVLLTIGLLLLPAVAIFAYLNIPQSDDTGGFSQSIGWLFFLLPSVVSVVCILFGVIRIMRAKTRQQTTADSGDVSGNGKFDKIARIGLMTIGLAIIIG
ncbi:MAG: hypothetical protein EOP48_24575, partial [Sphingobacteriales bacterium]